MSSDLSSDVIGPTVQDHTHTHAQAHTHTHTHTHTLSISSINKSISISKVTMLVTILVDILVTILVYTRSGSAGVPRSNNTPDQKRISSPRWRLVVGPPRQIGSAVSSPG